MVASNLDFYFVLAAAEVPIGLLAVLALLWVLLALLEDLVVASFYPIVF